MARKPRRRDPLGKAARAAGLTVDQRFKPREALAEILSEYPGTGAKVAEHVGHRFEELGGDPSAGQRAAIEAEAQLLGLADILLAQIAEQGITRADGTPNPLLTIWRQLREQSFKWISALGVEAPPRAPVNVADLFAELAAEAEAEERARAAADGDAADADTDTDSDRNTDESAAHAAPGDITTAPDEGADEETNE